MDNKEFDDIVGKKLGGDQDFPFDENQWTALESQLEEKNTRRGIIWWYWGAAAAVILLLGISVNSIFLQKRINHLEDQVNGYKNETPIATQSADPNTTIRIDENKIEEIVAETKVQQIFPGPLKNTMESVPQNLRKELLPQLK